MKATKKKKPRPYPVTTEDDSQFVITLDFGGQIVEGKGNTLLQALQSLKKPVKITTKSVIAITDGQKKFSRPLTVPMATRLFYPAAQIYHAKNFANLLK